MTFESRSEQLRKDLRLTTDSRYLDFDDKLFAQSVTFKLAKEEEGVCEGVDCGNGVENRGSIPNTKYNNNNKDVDMLTEYSMEDKGSKDEYEDVTLLQYDPPVLIPEKDKSRQNIIRQDQGQGDGQQNSQVSFAPALEAFQTTMKDYSKEFSYIKRHPRLRCTERALSPQEIEALLDLIKPPIEYTDNVGQSWRQRISSKNPVDCKDVHYLENDLDDLLIHQKAVMYGICPTRRKIHEDCFDELLRQIALETPERAIMLIRCRMQFQHSVKAYSELYGSVESYIMRQTVLEKIAQEKTAVDVQAMQGDRDRFLLIYNELSQKYKEQERKNQEETDKREKKHEDDLEFLRRLQKQLLSQIAYFKEGKSVKRTSMSAGTGGANNSTSPDNNNSTGNGKSKSRMSLGDAVQKKSAQVQKGQSTASYPSN